MAPAGGLQLTALGGIGMWTTTLSAYFERHRPLGSLAEPSRSAAVMSHDTTVWLPSPGSTKRHPAGSSLTPDQVPRGKPRRVFGTNPAGMSPPPTRRQPHSARRITPEQIVGSDLRHGTHRRWSNRSVHSAQPRW